MKRSWLHRVGIGTDADLTPDVGELLSDFVHNRTLRLPGRESRVELSLGAGFVLVAGGLALLAPGPRAFAPGQALALVAAYAAVSRIRFRDGVGYTVPTQLIFIPMLLLLPPSCVPLLVVAGLLLGQLPDFVRREAHVARAALTFGNAWHAVGPALVLALFGPGHPAWRAWPIYAAALVTQFAFDFAVSTTREWLGMGVSPRLQLKLLGWVYLVDLLLAPIGLLAAFAAREMPYAPLLLLPPAALLGVLSRERSARIDHALELGRAYRGTALLLGDVVDADDKYTGFHTRGVVSLALQVADRLGLDARQRRNAEFGALLHDVGKIAIPNELINKPGPLSDDEWTVMETHTVEGQRMLDRVGGVLHDVGIVVRSSHERWDGGGYPDRLAREAIPLESTIVAACDAFNAMTTDRSYRQALPLSEAVAELRRCSGSQFNPIVVEALIEIVGDGEAVAPSQLALALPAPLSA